jgi:membrane protein YqaA with SNARE-associated domain
LAFDISTALSALTHNTFFVKYGLAGLFVNSVLSPVIPIPTEIAVSALIVGEQSLFAIAIILAVGSIIGSLFGYFLGYSGNRTFLKLHKRTANTDLNREHKLLAKYGWLVMLFSPWMPFIGNVLIIMAGSKRYNFKAFAISIAAGQIIKAFGTVYLISIIIQSLKGIVT